MNTSVLWQQAAHTSYQLLLPSCSTSHTKSLSSNQKQWRIFWKKVERMDHQQKNDKAGTRPKSERGEGKGESRQIPDRRIAGTSVAAVCSKCTSKWQNRESDEAAHYHRTKTEVHSAHASTCYKPMESTTMKEADCTASCTLVLQCDH